MIYDYDIVIIGGGPGGYVAAIKAAKYGKTVCLCEKDSLGGVCLNEGCIPTKTLLKSAACYSELRSMKNFGVELADLDSAFLNMKSVQLRKKAVIKTLTNGIQYLLKQQKIHLINDTATFLDNHSIMCGENKITFENAIIATGSKVIIPPINIADGESPLTSNEVLDLDYIPDTAVVIGGGVVGVELAFFLSCSGSKVTILEQMDCILPMLDNEVSQKVKNDLNKQNIDIFTGVQVTDIEKNTITYKCNKENHRLNTNVTIIATGRTPLTDNLSLDTIGIEYSRNGIPVDAHMRTSIPNIYAIGDVNGKSMLAHTASAEGEIAVSNICGCDTIMNYDAIPYCVYLDPEIACVGLSEQQARQKFSNIKIGKFPLMANGKNIIEGQDSGLVKVIINGDTDDILGFHMYGIHSTDMVYGIVTAMSSGITGQEMQAAVFPHPTVSEAVHEAVLNAYGISIHI